MSEDSQQNNKDGLEANQSSENSDFVSAPGITLPKGGGAIRGIGEKFSANPVTGTGSMSIPVATSPGRAGFGPQLSLSYDSGAGNGIFGLGWNLGLPTITRKTDKGLPQYDDSAESDVFILAGAEDLVPKLMPDGSRYESDSVSGYIIHRYQPRIEGLFSRIERWTSLSYPRDIHWRTISKDNILTLYGKDAESRIFDPDDPKRIYSWLICETRDDKGNAVLYDYKLEDSVGVILTQAFERNRGDTDDPRRKVNRYLKRIRYGNRMPLLNAEKQRPHFIGVEQLANTEWMFEVVFDYGEHDTNNPHPNNSSDWDSRSDSFSNYRPGFEVRTTRLCKRVLMFHHFEDETGVGNNCLVRSTDFSYSQAPISDYTTLQKVTQTSYQRNAEDEGENESGYLKRSMPPVEFVYSQPEVQDKVEEIDAKALENLPTGVDGTSYQWIDLHGEGIPGILTEQASTWFYKRNVSPIAEMLVEFAPLERVKTKPNLSMAAGARIMDLAGDGQPDVVMLDGPAPGFYEHDSEESWQPFRPITSRLNRNLQDPNLKFIDLDGDGHADILITEESAFIWHASLAEIGFAPARRVRQELDEEKGPRLVFADGTQSIYLADLSGDGLTDLVRIRNNEICYWPNLGYCRFGAKVTMDNAPHFDHPDQFDHKRIRLTDIDGTGTIDIIYLHCEGVRLYFNQSGNAWSEPQILNVFPRVDDLVNIAVTDLLGNSTACLVWSSPLPGDAQRPMRYVNLMGEQKPHLLIKMINNLGAETEMQYAPSTKFYLQDKYAGNPWITKLPFPVHVVEKVTVTDKWQKTKFSTCYSYHHGYFDGKEREFRGFGRVEQVDVESYEEFSNSNTTSPNISDDTLYQPPIKTITWYHTGAMLDREKILSQYQQEYFPNGLAASKQEENVLGDFYEAALPEPVLNLENQNAETFREAMRACKGIVLRQEVYELDVDAIENTHQPVKLYSTAYHNCHIQQLQAHGNNPHAVFLVTESEAITYQYEQDLKTDTLTPDPRIAHTLNLNIDQYGHVLQSVAVVYPRIGQHKDDSLSEKNRQLIRDVQTETHIAYTETRYTNDMPVPDNLETENYRLRVPCESLSYEITGISPEDDNDRTTADGRDNLYFTLVELQQFCFSEHYQTTGIEIVPIDYHQIAETGIPQKRLIEQSRILYFNDKDHTVPEYLVEPLPFREQGNLGLPYETYTLALTDELLTAILTDKFTLEIQTELGDATKSGYLSGIELATRFAVTETSIDTTGQYWVRSGTAGFSDDAADHFFLPEQYTDAFNQTTTLDYDPRDLYIQSSTDPMGNTVSVEKFDYRVMAPSIMQDINDNLTEVIFDALGLPAATAIKGKGDQADNLNGFTDELLNPNLETKSSFFIEARRRSETIAEYQQRQQTEANRLLGNATARHLYYFGETEETLADGSTFIHWGEHPASACGIVREQHVAQLDTGETSPLQLAFEYSDGNGNVLVTKVQAEPENDGEPLRWIANGKTILNNKGKPVKQYEPYFSKNPTGEPSHLFAELQQQGVTPIMYYDAAGRLTRTEMPDGTFSRVEFSPWHVTSYDPNDTVKESRWYTDKTQQNSEEPLPRNILTGEISVSVSADQRAAWLTVLHHQTPSVTILDSLGRNVIAISHNRVQNEVGSYLHGGHYYRDEKYLTYTKLDAEGKPLWIRDARENLVMQYISPFKSSTDKQEQMPVDSVPCYDIAGNLLYQHSMDAGERWMINDATGQPFYAWDFNNRVTPEGEEIDEQRIYHTTYDALRRPLAQQLNINNDPEWQTERFKYGDFEGLFPSSEEAKQRNLRGQVYQHYDPSGLISNETFDFKGNLLKVNRRLASEYQADVIHWLEIPLETDFEDETFTQITEYDALNRMARLYNWHRGVGSRVAVYEPVYGERGVLKSEELIVGATKTVSNYEPMYPLVGTEERLLATRTTAVSNIRYDAKGQRQQITHGNGTVTHYRYDEKNYRLTHLLTTRTSDINSAHQQDLHYYYDPVGNITEIYDHAYEPVFFNNQQVKPQNRYRYDAIYRLIEASGRESYVTTGAPKGAGKVPDARERSFPISDQTLRNYTQKYTYDAVGNINKMQHIAPEAPSGSSERGGSWTRYYRYSETSNRLLSSWTGGNEPAPSDPNSQVNYLYDIHGSMLNLGQELEQYRPHWDYRDMIHHINSGGEQVYYNYDAEKQRTRKYIEKNIGEIEERLYLGGMEIYRRWQLNSDGSRRVVEEIETHHLFEGESRVLMVDDVIISTNNDLGNQTLYRYQYSNHLDSVGLELNEAGNVISYEEYHPYGTTAYSARGVEVTRLKKRYRYTGMERDEETGLSYHTARYYLPWLGRWTSSDPIFIVDGLNLFLYTQGSPLQYQDRLGTQTSPDVTYDFENHEVVGSLTHAREIAQDAQISTRLFESAIEHSAADHERMRGVAYGLLSQSPILRIIVEEIENDDGVVERLETGNFSGAGEAFLNIDFPTTSPLSTIGMPDVTEVASDVTEVASSVSRIYELGNAIQSTNPEERGRARGQLEAMAITPIINGALFAGLIGPQMPSGQGSGTRLANIEGSGRSGTSFVSPAILRSTRRWGMEQSGGARSGGTTFVNPAILRSTRRWGMRQGRTQQAQFVLPEVATNPRHLGLRLNPAIEARRRNSIIRSPMREAAIRAEVSSSGRASEYSQAVIRAYGQSSPGILNTLELVSDIIAIEWRRR